MCDPDKPVEPRLPWWRRRPRRTGLLILKYLPPFATLALAAWQTFHN